MMNMLFFPLFYKNKINYYSPIENVNDIFYSKNYGGGGACLQIMFLISSKN